MHKMNLHTLGLEGMYDTVELDVGLVGERREPMRSAYSEPLSELLARVKSVTDGDTERKLLVPIAVTEIRARENKRRGGLTVIQVVEESGIPFEIVG